MKTLLAFFKDYPLEKLWAPPFIHNTSLAIVELNGKERYIDLSYLKKGFYKRGDQNDKKSNRCNCLSRK
ncbi:hypothetical protein SLH48_19520 [Cytobacillus sp. IB215316]|nr:hypothetical protein [Cytobacillus sp. IB215316]MDX8362989.1 hypothetical protein [Cytobacillus sp. IB215316]